MRQFCLADKKHMCGIRKPRVIAATITRHFTESLPMPFLDAHNGMAALMHHRLEEEPENEPEPAAEEKSNHVRAIEDELRQKLATPVEIRLRGKDRGHIVLSFESNDDFMRLLEQLRR